MALLYGMNITASDMASLLEKNDKQQSGVRTWRQLFGGASLGASAQQGALATDYGDAIAEAYKSSFKQQNALTTAGLGAGITQEMLAASKNDLRAAYDTYVRNYTTDAAKIAENYNQEVGAIQTDLMTRATNFSNLYKSAYDYLANELYGSSYTYTDTSRPIYEGKGKKATVTGYETVTNDYLADHGLDWAHATDPITGLSTGELRSWESLSHELFNQDGSLTARGVAFFDQMFNTSQEGYRRMDGDTERTMYGFDEWLSKNNPELRDWWLTQDVYNYTREGTNRGSANVLSGRESTDKTYHPSEYSLDPVDWNATESRAAVVPYTNARVDAASAATDAQKAYENAMANRRAQVAAQTDGRVTINDRGQFVNTQTGIVIPAPAGINPDLPTLKGTVQYTKAVQAWQNYRSQASGMFNSYDTAIREKFGEQFWTENAALKSEWDDLIKRIDNTDIYDKALVDEIGAFYEKLMSTADAYQKSHAGVKKSSGY